jgi:hypothetical protein
MSSILKSDRVSVYTPLSYTNAPSTPLVSGTVDVEVQRSLSAINKNQFFGSRIRHRLTGGILVNAPTAPGAWNNSSANGVSAIDFYSSTSGPAVDRAYLHLYATTASPSTGENTAITSQVGSYDNASPGPIGQPMVYSNLPTIDSGLAVNNYGTIVKSRLVVDGFSDVDIGVAAHGLKVVNKSPNPGAVSTPLVYLHHRSQLSSTGPSIYINFQNGPTQTGSINTPSTTTTYSTSSDYRLKENINPVESGLDIITALRPRSWTWKVNDETDMGFIAHEVQEDAPLIAGAVTGKKDEVIRYGKLIDANGDAKLVMDSDEELQIPEPSEEDAARYASEGYTWTHFRDEPIYQGIDTSFMVAPLVAAVKELKAIVDQQQAQITALEQRIVALETA